MFKRHRCPEPKQVNGQTLEEVVKAYLNELENPAPDFGMRAIYRSWMRDFFDWN